TSRDRAFPGSIIARFGHDHGPEERSMKVVIVCAGIMLAATVASAKSGGGAGLPFFGGGSGSGGGSGLTAAGGGRGSTVSAGAGGDAGGSAYGMGLDDDEDKDKDQGFAPFEDRFDDDAGDDLDVDPGEGGLE